MYRCSPLRSTLNTNVITGLDMRKVCAEAVHCVALWTRTLPQVWTCVKYVPPQHKSKLLWIFTHLHRFWHVWGKYKCQQNANCCLFWPGTLKAEIRAPAILWNVGNARFHAAIYARPANYLVLWTAKWRGLDMCKIWNEAVHCVALRTLCRERYHVTATLPPHAA